MITIVMSTYAPEHLSLRADYACKCLGRLYQNLPKQPLAIHLADDGSSTDNLDKMINKACWHFGESYVSYTRAPRSGIGGSLNLALKKINGLWMYTTDDWMLTSQLWLRSASVLICDLGYDLVRLGPIHPNLYCRTQFNAMAGWYLHIYHEQGGYAFATRPFLATKEFYNKIGPFDEGLNAYETERIYAERVARADVKIAAITLEGFWNHIGEQEVGTIDPTAK